MIDPQHGWNVSFKPQFLGFVFSLVLILAAYRIVTHYHLTDGVLTYTVIALAMVQAIIQLVFFLHLGLESKPRWNMITFLFTILIVAIIFGGSLWIMHQLDYNVMPASAY